MSRVRTGRPPTGWPVLLRSPPPTESSEWARRPGRAPQPRTVTAGSVSVLMVMALSSPDRRALARRSLSQRAGPPTVAADEDDSAAPTARCEPLGGAWFAQESLKAIPARSG